MHQSLYCSFSWTGLVTSPFISFFSPFSFDLTIASVVEVQSDILLLWKHSQCPVAFYMVSLTQKSNQYFEVLSAGNFWVITLQNEVYSTQHFKSRRNENPLQPKCQQWFLESCETDSFWNSLWCMEPSIKHHQILLMDYDLRNVLVWFGILTSVNKTESAKHKAVSDDSFSL